MHTTLSKHVNQELDFGSNFSDQLASGDTLTGVPVVKVLRGTGKRFNAESGRFEPVGGWADVTSQFLSDDPAPEIQGAVVAFRLKTRAAATEQLAGTYIVRCECATANSENLEDQFELEVDETAVP